MIRLPDIIRQLRVHGTGECTCRGFHQFTFLREERLWICDRCCKVVKCPLDMGVKP